jgi:hypothetical protein
LKRYFLLVQLEAGVEAKGEASCGPNGIAGEETAEVDNVETVVQIVTVGLKTCGDSVALVYICSKRGLNGQRGVDTATVEVETVDDGRPVLGESIRLLTVNSNGRPEPERSPAANQIRGIT